jgi:DNA-binding transcriptional ArsR family regulator
MVKVQSGYQQQAQLFRVLSHPVRLHVLDILARQEACVCHLTAILGKRQPYVSQQLASLREAGLVSDRREGTLIYYRLVDERVAELLDESKSLLYGPKGRTVTFPPLPDGALEGCSCPRCQGE